MGIALDIPTKTIVAFYNEAWTTTIQSANNASSDLWADPIVTINYRERTMYSDGSFSATNDPDKTSPTFVPQVSFKMSSAVMRNGTLYYKDRTGVDKTIPQCDVPLTVRAFLDLVGTEARAARTAEIAAEELASLPVEPDPEPEPDPEV